MVLCGILMSRADASAGSLVSCHSLFDNDIIGNENETFYNDINKTITNLLSRNGTLIISIQEGNRYDTCIYGGNPLVLLMYLPPRYHLSC